MHPWTATAFFTFSTLKTVDDHCGYAVPWDPFQKLFRNNAEYHDIHHWGKGIRYNFSQVCAFNPLRACQERNCPYFVLSVSDISLSMQPFFIHWDVWMGTDYHRAMAKLARSKANAEGSSGAKTDVDGVVSAKNLKSMSGPKTKKRLRRADSALELINWGIFGRGFSWVPTDVEEAFPFSKGRGLIVS